MSERSRELVGRGTMLVVGSAIVWGGLWVIRAALRLGGGAEGVLLVVAVIVLLVGGFALLIGLIPASWTERLMRPTPPTTGETTLNASDDSSSWWSIGYISDWFWW